MKRLVSLMLVLIIALSLCACGAKGKYVGTYKQDVSIGSFYGGYFDKESAHPATIKLTLNKDMTGSFIVTYTEDVKVFNNMTGNDVVFSAQKGQIYASYDLTWETDDDCIIIYYDGVEHSVYGSDYESSGSFVAEKVGNRLSSINGSIHFEGAAYNSYYIKEK